VSATTERTDPRDAPARVPETGERRPVALVAAAALVVVVVGLVLTFGVIRPPALSPLDAPGFDGAVAFTEWGREACVVTVTADGTRTPAWCDAQGGELVGWPERGLVVRSWRHELEQLVTIDPATGEELASVSADGASDPGWPEPELGPSVVRAGRLEVRYDDQVLWSTEARDPYEVTAGWVSPDGTWIALQDTAERLLVVPADGSAPPQVWAEDVSPYVPIVWRGTSGTGA
jgi:hypothetical protein